MDIRGFMEALATGPFAWPGGYPLFFVTSNGDTLAFGSAWKERAQIYSALQKGERTGGWHVESTVLNFEDPSLRCDHDGGRIEAAYVDNDDHPDDPPVNVPFLYFAWRKRYRAKYPK